MSPVVTGEHTDLNVATAHGDWAHVALSPRQRQILTLLRAGKSNKEIATDLNIGLGTTKQHLVTLFKKLGATNRAMAISKSQALTGASVDGPVAIERPERDRAENISYRERRPVAVLCLRPDTKNIALDADTIKHLNRLYSDVAFDFDAGFLVHSGGRCDLIFGIRQVRRHDILRAVRAAVSISKSIGSALREDFQLQAGLAYGYIAASMDKDGDWTGEAIQGGVMATAQNEMNHAAPGRINLHHTAKTMIEHIGFDADQITAGHIALSPTFRWRAKHTGGQTPLVGRAPELEVLRAALQDHADGKPGIISIQGETGMGKTELLHAFIGQAEAARLTPDYWTCSLADSQPGAPSLGWLAHADGTQFLDLSNFCKTVLRQKTTPTDPLIIENCHNLTTAKFVELLTVIKKYGQNQFIVISHRGPLPALQPDGMEFTALHLKRLSEREMTTVLCNLLGPAHRAEKWIKQMAQGVPLFLRQLVSFALVEIENQRNRPGIIPPIELCAVICERVESHNLDRRLLHVIAKTKNPETVMGLAKSWPGDRNDLRLKLEQAVASGVVEAVTGHRRAATQYRISHPLLVWVFSILFLSPVGPSA